MRGEKEKHVKTTMKTQVQRLINHIQNMGSYIRQNMQFLQQIHGMKKNRMKNSK